ncbi:MAG: hypothetical protein PHE59_02260 [Patescibacteria group bacterium]|nr:hypothetical protein [Patescibacteria group bacterium]MDD5164405.1 hypothetical protein [Patescibacteria group bacterium]MDD5534943.1 hypothetical protein [Patescibacteria group bacterium]
MAKWKFPYWGIIGCYIVRIDAESDDLVFPKYKEGQAALEPVSKSNEMFKVLKFKTVEAAIKAMAKIKNKTEKEILKEVQDNFPSMEITLKKRSFFFFWKR